MDTTIRPTRATIENRRTVSRLALLAIAALMVVLGVGVVALNARAATLANVTRSEALPFGPGWAADYGTTHTAAVDSFTHLPFGPGWAANYGTENSYPLPFGPEVAATYGARSNAILPFGPGLAATYGVPTR
jgi:hypothetical protein